MQGNFTSAEWTALEQGLARLFDKVQVEEGQPGPAAGLTVAYSSQLMGTDCVLRLPVTVDGVPRTVELRGRVAGAGEACDPITDREAALYQDDRIRDFLTGAYNRRYWETVFCSQLASCGTARHAAVALVKIDGFGGVVKGYGQPAADQLTCYVANLWKRFYDEGSEKVVCRLTGHTFAVGCLDTDEADLEAQMQVLYGKMHKVCTTTVGMMQRVPFTLSIACAGTDEPGLADWPALYCKLDERLRAQRAAGGDGVYTVDL